jgi:hypothetical protein
MQRWPVLNARLWQRNYYEHIIRPHELEIIREYISTNPVRWELDWENILAGADERTAKGHGPASL